MGSFTEGEWPTYIGRVIIWFGNVDAHVDTIIERCGSRELCEKLRGEVLGDRAKKARALSLASVADELRVEINAAFDELDSMIAGVRNHVAHPIPTLDLGSGLVLGFRRRGQHKPIYMSLVELRKAAEDSEALAQRLMALIERYFPKS
jgi:hypothetical protein